MKGSGGIKFDRGQVRQDNLEGRGRVQRGGELECTKKSSQKKRHIWHLVMPLGGYRPISYIFWKAEFRDNISIVDSVPLC